MNPWVKRTLDLVAQDGYLDKLHDVYSVAKIEPRKIDADLIGRIVKAHGQGNPFDLVSALLELDKFPVDDIYVGFLRIDENAINANPATVKRIGSRLLSMPVEDVLKACRQPIVSNRQMGELFHNWFAALAYPRLNEDEFSRLNSYVGIDKKEQTILTLEGTRKEYRDFVNRELNCGLEKELDVLVKVNGDYIIGEAKFFSAFGGHQFDQFKDAVDDFLLKSQGNATRIAVLDGVVWLDTGEKMCLKARRLDSIAMSALLLPRFLTDYQTAS